MDRLYSVILLPRDALRATSYFHLLPPWSDNNISYDNTRIIHISIRSLFQRYVLCLDPPKFDAAFAKIFQIGIVLELVLNFSGYGIGYNGSRRRYWDVSFLASMGKIK